MQSDGDSKVLIYNKDERVRDFVWLTIEDVKLVLRQPDINKKTGIRDRFFIALMYESGCRDDEYCT